MSDAGTELVATVRREFRLRDLHRVVIVARTRRRRARVVAPRAPEQSQASHDRKAKAHRPTRRSHHSNHHAPSPSRAHRNPRFPTAYAALRLARIAKRRKAA